MYTPPDIDAQLIAVWGVPACAFGGRWYGVRVTVTRGSDCRAECHYDHNWAGDLGFFESWAGGASGLRRPRPGGWELVPGY